MEYYTVKETVLREYRVYADTEDEVKEAMKDIDWSDYLVRENVVGAEISRGRGGL